VAADVVGYSRLMQEDDEATLAALAACRNLFSEVVSARRGRIVNAPGDSILAEFASVLDAVESAMEIQQRVAAQNAQVPEPKRMQFRIGVNVGDVLVDPAGAIYGDGVNIAARLEALASPGGICLAKAVCDQVATRLRLDLEDLGEKTVKNFSAAVHVYRVKAQGAGPAAAIPASPNSIAVLAFDNLRNL